MTDNQKADLKTVEDAAAAFLAVIGSLGTGRELSLAKTKIEEAAMWAAKHVTA
ncbi:hypothetical protein DWF04_006110 [Cereibacter sphaeroides f. sp. denitrificans]